MAPAARGLRCEYPPELRGLIFLDLEPLRFCTAPLVVKLAIQDIQTYSVVVSWQSRNHSGIHGYRVAYHALDRNDMVRSKLLDRGARTFRLARLHPDTRYLICVGGLGNWIPSSSSSSPTPSSSFAGNTSMTMSSTDLSLTLAYSLVDSATTKCTQVRTLEKADGGSILTRRLGLIVGSCMGFVVFIVLVGVLTYLKLKKQQEAKRDQPLPQEYISYRHFSIQSAEGVCGTGTTSLNT